MYTHTLPRLIVLYRSTPTFNLSRNKREESLNYERLHYFYPIPNRMLYIHASYTAEISKYQKNLGINLLRNPVYNEHWRS